MDFGTLIPPVDTILVFLLVFTRIGAMMAIMPVFGITTIPMRFKAGAVFGIALMVVSLLHPDSSVVEQSGGAIILSVFSEVLLGSILGLFIRLVVEAVSLGASIVGFQMGFAIVNVIDPASGSNVSLVSNFQTMVAAGVFIISGLYRIFFLGIIRSFDAIPPGQVALQAHLGEYIIKAGSEFFVNGILVAAPIMLTLLLSKIALGIVARTVPQMNIFIVGMPLTIGMGLVLLGLTLPFMVQVTLRGFNSSFITFQSFIQATAQ